MTYKKAQQIAHGLIQSYIGPDHRVMDMQSFFGRAGAGTSGSPSARLERPSRSGEALESTARHAWRRPIGL